MELTLDAMLSTGGLLGNLSYVLLIVSMAMRDIFWLRLFALFSGVTGVAYDAFWLHDPVGVFWETCFTLVNAFQWLWLVYDERRGSLTHDQARLKLFLFPTLPDAAFRKLLAIADLREVPEGTLLTRQGDPVSDLIVLSDGVADVHVDDVLVATCRAGDVLGEISFLNRTGASATVITHTPARFFCFDIQALGGLLERSEEMNRAFAAMLNTHLARKLVRSNASR